jgi:8-oxo-dGTP pyrophosphatase MutT (NUDIX family)
VREAWEEIALDPALVRPLGLGDPYETVTGFIVTPVVAWVAAPPSLTPQPDEVADIFETPWDFLMDAANHRRDFYDREGQARRWFWAVPWGERYIWGATAGIVRGLCDRLYGGDAAAAAEDAA